MSELLIPEFESRLLHDPLAEWFKAQGCNPCYDSSILSRASDIMKEKLGAKLDKDKEEWKFLGVSTKGWMIFICVVLMICAYIAPAIYNTYETRDGLDCIIEQLAEHRVNNRKAHQADAHTHGYDYDVAEPAVPHKIGSIDPGVCDRWLNEPVQ